MGVQGIVDAPVAPALDVLERIVLATPPEEPTEEPIEAATSTADPVVPSVATDWSARAVIAGAVAALAVAIVWYALRVWGNADVHWSWLLVEQFADGSPKALSLVDGNRLFPDLAFGLAVRTVLHLCGIVMLSRHYVIIYSIAVVAVSLLGFARMLRSRVATALAIATLAAVFVPNLAYMEAIRPGYHALSAAVSLLVVSRRVRRLGRPYSAAELMVLTMLVVSGRFLVTVLVAPLFFSDVFARHTRAHKSWRLVLPAGFGLLGWALVKNLPNVHVSYARTPFYAKGLLTWFLDYGRVLTWVRRPPGALILPTHAALFVTLVLLTAVRWLRRGRATPLSPARRYVVVLALATTEIGGATLRAGNYVVGWRTYIFILPMLMACAAIAVLCESLVSRSAVLRVAAALLIASIGAIAVTGRALERHPLRGWLTEAHGVIERHGLIRKVGLSNYWVGYEVRGTFDDRMRIYNVDAYLNPYFWSINPWDLFYDREHGRVAMDRRIDYVLSIGMCDAHDCDDEGFTPHRDAIVKTLGEPSRWIVEKRATYRYRLAIYDHGAAPALLIKRWKVEMDLAGIDTSPAKLASS